MELHRLRPRLQPAADDVVWVTPDTPQSRSLLAGEEVVHVPFVAPRGYRAIAANARLAGRILRETGAERVVSTGAGIALAFLPIARRRGLSCHYIESAARTDGPSLTGRLLQVTRAAHLYAQYPDWAKGPWQYRGSVFDDVELRPGRGDGVIRRVLVSCGTMPFPFDRLVHRLVEVLPPDADVTWQLGFDEKEELPGTVVTELSYDVLEAEMQAADLVVCHAGVGSALTALSAGHRPVLIPRMAEFGEHVDDHQVQVAALLADHGLAVTCDAEQVEAHHLEEAAAASTAPAARPPGFRLTRSEPGARAARAARRAPHTVRGPSPVR